VSNDREASWTGRSLFRKVPNALAVLALIIWFSHFLLFYQYDGTRPTVPQPYEGRVFGQNNHGHVVYLTTEEEFRIDFMRGVAFALFMTGFLIQHVRDHPEFKQDANGVMLRMFYGILSPLGWYGGLVHLWQAVVRMARKGPRSLLQETCVRLSRRDQKISFVVSFDVTECRTRIKNAFGYATYGFAFSGEDNRSFQLWKRIRNYANSFAPVFSGKLIECPSGTCIEGSFGPTEFARVFSGIWFVGVTAIGAYLAFLGIQDVLSGTNNLHGNAYVGIFFPLLLILAGVLIVSCCKRLAADEEDEIIALLKKVLDV
jgi:hypothetical protein